MEIVLITLVALCLNMCGAVISKYFTLNMGCSVSSVLLIVLLFATFIARFVFWIVVGKRWQLSFIYPVLSVNYFISFLLGMLLFNEPFHLNRCLGAMIIVGGVWGASLSENSSERRAI